MPQLFLAFLEKKNRIVWTKEIQLMMVSQGFQEAFLGYEVLAKYLKETKLSVEK